MSERTPADYAIEHAEYMAKAVEAMLEFINKSGIGAHAKDQDGLTDHWRSVQSHIYEFRKRAARADGASQPAPSEKP